MLEMTTATTGVEYADSIVKIRDALGKTGGGTIHFFQCERDASVSSVEGVHNKY